MSLKMLQDQLNIFAKRIEEFDKKLEIVKERIKKNVNLVDNSSEEKSLDLRLITNFWNIAANETPDKCINHSCRICTGIKGMVNKHASENGIASNARHVKACFAALVWNYKFDVKMPVMLMLTKNDRTINVPGGLCDGTECYWRTVQRETEEEAGIDLTGKYNQIISIFTTNHNTERIPRNGYTATFVIYYPGISRKAVNAMISKHNNRKLYPNPSYHEMLPDSHTVRLISPESEFIEVEGVHLNKELIASYVQRQFRRIKKKALTNSKIK
jgi:8-oxo-dGTP pyrophosphatase MutT (NUDIX family)